MGRRRERERERNIQTGSERGRCRCLSDTTPRDAGSAEAHCRAHQHALARRQAAESGGQKERERDIQTDIQTGRIRRAHAQAAVHEEAAVRAWSSLWRARWKSDPCDMQDRTEGQSSRCRAHGHVSRGEWQGLEGEWLWRAAKSHYLSGGASRARRSCPRLTATLHVDQSVQVQHSVLASSRRE